MSLNLGKSWSNFFIIYATSLGDNQMESTSFHIDLLETSTSDRSEVISCDIENQNIVPSIDKTG